MLGVPAFYSVNETQKPPADRVYHDNGTCASGRDIRRHEKRTGTGGYRLCDNCQNLNKRER